MPTLNELNVNHAPWKMWVGKTIHGTTRITVDSWAGSEGIEVAICHKEPNARLIAAAPDLYNACLDVYNFLSARQQPEAKEILRKALAKAAGKEVA